MLITNIKFVLRRLQKHPIFTGINGIGLTLGLVTFFFLLQYVLFQWSFNEMYAENDRTYRLLESVDQNELSHYTAPGIAPLMKENIPGVELATRYMPNIGSGVILIEEQGGKKTFREDQLSFVDDDFLQMFNLPTLAGQPNLVRPNTAVLTESSALQFFQTTDVVGKSFNLINQFGEHPFEITGVMEDFPADSDISTNVLASMSTFATKEYIGRNTWMDISSVESNFVWTFLRLSNPEVQENIIAYRKRIADENESVNTLNVALQSISSMHLDSGKSGILPTFGNPRLVWFLLILAMLILAIAWINYVNLSTAQSLQKARSVSVRKVIGASRWQLIKQQLTETLLLTFGSVLLAGLTCFFLQPFFNYLVDLPLEISLLLDWKFLLGTSVFLLATSLAAGFYVAIILTGFDPSVALKGSFGRSTKGIFVRKALVTTQFVISIAFIAGTAIMLMQINFLQNKDVGIATEQRLAILGPAGYTNEISSNREVFLNQLMELPYVKQHSASGGIPGRGINFSFSNFSKEKDQMGKEAKDYSMVFVDEKYFDIYDIEIIAGNAPTAEMVESGWWQHHKILLNETAVRQLGFDSPAEAVQQIVYYKNGETIEELEIYGVTEDYNHRSLHAGMMPLVFGPGLNHVWFTLLLNGEVGSDQLATLEKMYQERFPKDPFIYQYVDEFYHQFYEEDRRLSKLISAATFLAIFISCLGLFGLAAHTVEQRTKEIGIRKVLGANLTSIVGLITKDFIPLVLIAIVIASPLAWYVLDNWLQDFAYRIDMQWWVFAVAGFAAVLIAFLTVSFQSVKAVLANPVESLRNE